MSSNHINSPGRPKISLEAKLELLESRFTKPSTSPSEATLDPFSSPHVNSHQSFSFDTPSKSSLQFQVLERAAAQHISKILESTSTRENTNPTSNVRDESPVPKTDKRKSVPVKRETVSVKDKTKDGKEKIKTKRTTSPENSRDGAKKRTKSKSLSPERSRESNKRAKNKLISSFFTIKQGKPSAAVESSVDNIYSLQQRIEELERAYKDKDEQLKAVSNNRTILHSALQAALTKREQELEDAKRKYAEEQANRTHVLEEWIRANATRQDKDVRERLALDGTRLGRIVYNRVGMRSVETWEDGHASKAIKERRQLLQKRKRSLEQRQTLAQSAWRRVTNDDLTGNKEIVGGIPVRTRIEAIEALESVRMHLSNLAKQEKELVLEERSLNEEKGAHIRALKRIANEDASRFRSRPKLNDRYVLLSLLGKGGFSEVWRAYDLLHFREVAVKIHQLDPRWSDAKKENYTRHVSREYEIHRNVRHPRIVSLFDVFEIDTNSFATVLECCNGTDLDTLLKEKHHLPEVEARSILLQILLGMQYLSQPSPDGTRAAAIHYDLKPGNILFDENGDAKITDFGLSKILDSQDAGESMELTSQGAGTYWYLPPECFIMEDNVRISSKVDVWSIGVIFYQMLFGRRPFGDGISQDKILADGTMLNAREVRFPDQPPVSDEGKQFIRACLTYDQVYRPTIAQLCEHPYIHGIHSANDAT